MRLLFIFSFYLLTLIDIQAQSDSLKRIKEINEQVWKPFIIALTSRNNKDLQKLHSRQITRVEIDNNVVMDFEKYFPENSGSSYRQNKLQFELRFDKRIGNNDREWESGYYQGTVMETGKANRVYYGRFYVLLWKENGVWKIVLDADTHTGATEQSFNAAAAME